MPSSTRAIPGLLFGDHIEPSADLVLEVLAVEDKDSVENRCDLNMGVSLIGDLGAGSADIGCVCTVAHGLHSNLPAFGVLQPVEGPLVSLKAIGDQLLRDTKRLVEAEEAAQCRVADVETILNEERMLTGSRCALDIFA